MRKIRLPRPFIFGVPFAVLFLAFLGGCSAYLDDFQYGPRPAVTAIPSTQPLRGQAFSASVAVIGVRRDDHHDKIPSSVEVVLRLENNSPQTVTFNPRSLEMNDAVFTQFQPPLLRSPQPVTLAPTESATVRAFFPFPPGRSYDDTDMSSLQVHWRVNIDNRSVAQGVDFRRAQRIYYAYPYWAYGPYYPYPYGGWYGGVIVYRR